MLIFRKMARWIAWVCISVLLMFACIILVGRYYFSPRIDQWRPQLQSWLQTNVYPQLILGEIALDWSYWTPSVHFQQVELGTNGELARVDNLLLELDVFSFLRMTPKVKRILAKEAQLMIERNTQGEIRVGGKALSLQEGMTQTLNPSENIAEVLLPWLDWGFERLPDEIQIQQGHIIWRDQYAEERPDLAFSPMQLTFKHDQSHLNLQLSVSIAEMSHRAMQMQANLSRDGQGNVNIQWHHWQPQYLKKWLHFPLFMKSGEIEEAKADLSFEKAKLKTFSTDWSLKDFQFLEKNDEENGLVLQGDKIRIAIRSAQGLSYPYQFELRANQLHVQAKDFFRHPMDFNQIEMRGEYRLNAHDKTQLSFEQLDAQLPYGSLSMQGVWDAHPESDNGFIQLKGAIQELELNKLPYYLPKAIAAESLDWLEKAFVKGYIENAKVDIHGNVDHIPFGLRAESGDFRIQGPVKDLVLHYHQFPSRDNTFWPDIVVPNAEVDFNRDVIRIKGERLQLDEKYNLPALQASDAEVYVRQIEKNAQVDIRTYLKTDGESVLKFYRQSPLRPLLLQVLDKSQIKGQMEGSLNILIPIMRPDETKVDSQFHLQGVSFQFTPDHPVLSQANGVLKISEKNVQLYRVKARLLGGEVNLSGAVGSKGDRLSLKGHLTAQGLYQYLPLTGIQKRVKGSTNYTIDIDFLGEDNIDVQVKSQLKGLGIDLPQGLSKSVHEAIPLNIVLSAPKNGRAEQLTIDYKNQWLQVLLERHDRRSKQFNRGIVAVNVKDKLILPTHNMKLQLHSGDWDVMTWLNFVDEFSFPTTQDKTNTPLFPAVQYLTIDADRLSLFGAYIPQIILSGERRQNDWLLDINAKDAQGSVVLHLGKTEVEKISLALKRFNLQTVDLEKTTEHQASRVDLPVIQGEIKDFLWQGKRLGHLHIESYLRAKDHWHLKQLSLSNEVGSLYATGELKSIAQQTEGDIRLNLNALNMGKFFGFLGFDNMLKAGKGHLQLQVHSRDVSDISLNSLSLKGELHLEHGALLQLNSTAMKVLAVISLQSLSNLSNLNKPTPSVFSKGLVFDYLRSKLELKNHQVYVEDFRLNGPLVAVVAAGQTHLVSKQLDFEAAVIPKIDMSGAAVLTGVIVNPVAGLGAFLSQWLLSKPLNRALTAYFSIKGTWDNPLINDKALPSEEELKEKRKQQEINRLYRN